MKLVIWVLIFSFGLAQAKNFSVEEKLADFNSLNISIDSSYGPLMYKQSAKGLKINELRNQYRAEIAATQNNSEFYYTMIRYVSEYQDGHFAAVLPGTTYKAELPIMTDLIDGKVLIDVIDRKRLPETQFPYSRGDEIISMNGQNIQDVIQGLIPYVGKEYEAAGKRAAAQALFVRSARRFPVPKGAVEFEVRRGTSDIIEKVKMNWIESGVSYDEKVPPLLASLPSSEMNYDMLSMRPMLDFTFGPDRIERSFRCSPGTRIGIPQDAVVIMRDPFFAYYHPTEKGNVGYLRIPHYIFPDYVTTFKKYEYAIQILEKNTVGLIIDQDHNCGGSVDFLHQMVSLFISKPTQPMQFELLASKAEYFSFKSWIDKTPSDTIEYKESEKVLELIKTTWEKGDFLTSKTSIGGEDFIYPNRYIYTKPVVMLIDELSGSGGDAFPAIMGGNKRATLFGSRTWGLGGHVQPLAPLQNSGINVYLTKSLFYRPDGVAVENNGVDPDIQYTPTRDDFMYEYKNYQKAYLKVLLDKIN